MKYTFKKPFTYLKEKIETVELNEEFTAGDLIRVLNAEKTGDKLGAIVAAATGWPLPKIAQMSPKDLKSIEDIVMPFFDLGEEGG